MSIPRRPSVLFNNGDDDQVAPQIFKVTLRTTFYFMMLKLLVLKLKEFHLGNVKKEYSYMSKCVLIFSRNQNLGTVNEEKTDGLVSIWKTGGRHFFYRISKITWAVRYFSQLLH